MFLPNTLPCYDCGRLFPEHLAQSYPACLWKDPDAIDGAEHWSWAEVCPSCARRRVRRRRAVRALGLLLAGAFAFALGYRFLP
jgi:hypothetical protein